MAKDNTVTAVLLKNPSVKRSFTYASAKSNGIIDGKSKKWRLEEAGENTLSAKKKDVEPVAVNERVLKAQVQVDEVILPEDTEKEFAEFANIEQPVNEIQAEQPASPKSPKEFLQDEYKQLSGKDADGRWSEKKLAEEIVKLKKQGNDEAQ